MVGSEWSGVTEELGPAVTEELELRPRCVVPSARPSAINRSDQRVPVYWDQTVPVWSGSERKKSSSGETGCRDELSGPGARRGDGSGASSDSTGAAPGVSFDAILSMYESSLVEKSFTPGRVLSSRGRGRRRSRSLLQPRDDDPRRAHGRRRQFAVISASDLGEPEVQSLRAAIERTTICNSIPSHSLHHCNVIVLERQRRSRSWQEYPLRFPHRYSPRAPSNFAEAGA